MRRLGETLNEMLERLQRALERERRFVADASHELRTPVAVIKTELEGALRAGGHEPRVREALVAAVEECDNLAQLAEDLLVVGATGRERCPCDREPLPACTRCSKACASASPTAPRERGRAIVVDALAGLAVCGDDLRLRQALGNLVDNALRHGDGRDRAARAPRATAAWRSRCEDAGPGFGADIAGHAFERFARSDSARGRDGTGLGLAIVRTIAEAHGGRAELVPGRGRERADLAPALRAISARPA